MNGKLILALDVSNSMEASRWVKRLSRLISFYKVGKQLFTAEGPAVVKKIKEGGGKVFLDLKFHDIPNTVAAASREAVRIGADIINVHALGGYDMMARAVEAVGTEAESLGIQRPLIIAVTVLTSMSQEALAETGILNPISDEVRILADLAKKAGMDGVVASPQEIGLIRGECGDNFTIVTPGVRPSFASIDDQKRVMTPQAAVSAGADYLVIGRPITRAENPEMAVRMITEEMCQE